MFFILFLFKVLNKIKLLQAVLISFRVSWFSKVFCFNLRNVKEIKNYALIFALTNRSLLFYEQKDLVQYMYIYIYICGGKQWQTTPKNLPRMQCAKAITVT